MALLGVTVGDIDVCWTDASSAKPFCITLYGSADHELDLSREAFEALVIAVNRLHELDLTRDMKIRMTE